MAFSLEIENLIGLPYRVTHSPRIDLDVLDAVNCQRTIHLIYEKRLGIKLPVGMWSKEIYEDEGNILVCECKIWAGQALYHSTINQLIGYLTWRNNFGVMITFVKKKNLTKILEEIPAITTSHPNYVNGFRKINDTHFVSHNHLAQDTHKNVELHHLLYNLYLEE